MKSFSEIKSLSKQQLSMNWKLPVLFALISILLGFWESSFKDGNLILSALGIVISYYGCIVYLNIAKYNHCESIKIPGNKLLKLILFSVLIFISVFLLTLVSIILPTFLMIGTGTIVLPIILLIIAVLGLLALEVYISFVPFLILDMDYSIFESFKYSFKYMKGNFFKTVWLYITFIPWILLGLITFTIGFLYVMPYLELVYTNYYLELKESYNLNNNISDDTL